MKRLITILLILGFAHTVMALPKIQHWKTTNGARVYFIQATELPMLDVHVIFNAGSVWDGDKYGLANLTNALLDQGAGQWSADQLAEKAESLGVELGNTIDYDTGRVTLRCLTDPPVLKSALELLSTVLSQPTFDKGALERIREQMLVHLKAKQQSPDDIADEAFDKSLYPNHPYGIPSDGTMETVSKLTQTDIKEFHSRYYVSKNAIVVMVGALDRAMAETVANTIVGSLPVGESAPKLATVKPLEKAETIAIQFPSTQTTITIGQIGITRQDPDYFPLFVGNHIFGGNGLVSRLSKEVREKRGLVYGVSSYFWSRLEKGNFSISLQTRNEKAKEATLLVQDMLREFVEKGPTEEELKMAKQNITGSFILRIDSNGELIWLLGNLAFFGLPLDFLDTYKQNVEAVTVEDIKAAFKRHIQPDKLVTVTVGQAQ